MGVMRTSEKSSTIAAALYAVHRDLENPRKDAKGQVRGNPNYRYLSLPALIDHARKALRDASLAVVQEVTFQEYGVGVTTRFVHVSGEWLELGPTVVPVEGANNPQAVGSAITYARRYALAAALNLAADEDDDAVSATSSPAARSQVPRGDGDAERGAGGEADAYGEGATAEPPASQPVAGPYDPHPNKPHVLKDSKTLAGARYCIVKGCDYVLAPENAKPTRQEAHSA